MFGQSRILFFAKEETEQSDVLGKVVQQQKFTFEEPPYDPQAEIEKSPKKSDKRLRSYLTYASMGIQMVIVMGICTWAGLQLDRQLALRFPVFLSLFSVGATVLSVYGTIRKLLKHIQQEERQR